MSHKSPAPLTPAPADLEHLYAFCLDGLGRAERDIRAATDLLPEVGRLLAAVTAEPLTASHRSQRLVALGELVKAVGISITIPPLEHDLRRYIANMDDYAAVNATVESARAYRQDVVKTVNELLRGKELSIRHPVTGRPCVFVAISDDFGAKYSLRDKETGKRSLTCRTFEKFHSVSLTSETVERIRQGWEYSKGLAAGDPPGLFRPLGKPDRDQGERRKRREDG